MRFSRAFFATALMLAASQATFADINLTIVKDYASAANPAVWKGVKTDTVPEALTGSVQQRDPSNSYASLFPKSFYQEENFLVCFKNCAQSDAQSGRDALEQQNVYYWLVKFFNMAKERFDLAPSERVRVLVDRDVKDPGSSKTMRNNAFFNPADSTLSFLPTSANPLAAIIGGDKLNRSGFDPSVIAHEAGHSLFHKLFPHSINPEIDGFNEGFADYMSNILMGQSQVGLVMMRGKVIRDSGSLVDAGGNAKTYQPGLEAHDMGERFATALWLSRAEVEDKLEFDHLVIDAVADIARNPFATGHAFKEALLARVNHMYEIQVASKISALWEMLVEGEDREVHDVSFLKSTAPATNSWGLRVESRFSESASRELGLKGSVARFTYIKSEKTEDGLVAHLVAASTDSTMTPYWILMDPSRKNALGAWNFDGSAVEEDKLDEVSSLTGQLLTMGETLNDFLSKAKMFTELSNGKGDLSGAYKVTGHDRDSSQIVFAGQQVNAVTHTLKLKRKLLARLLFGIPPVKSVKIITLPGAGVSEGWPSLEGATVIGVAMELEDGTLTETVFERVKKIK